MEIFLAAAATVTVLVGAQQTLQYFLARHIQRLVLAGSKFHLAQNSSGAVELRSGVRHGALTQKEARSDRSRIALLHSSEHADFAF